MTMIDVYMQHYYKKIESINDIDFKEEFECIMFFEENKLYPIYATFQNTTAYLNIIFFDNVFKQYKQKYEIQQYYLSYRSIYKDSFSEEINNKINKLHNFFILSHTGFYYNNKNEFTLVNFNCINDFNNKISDDNRTNYLLYFLIELSKIDVFDIYNYDKQNIIIYISLFIKIYELYDEESKLEILNEINVNFISEKLLNEINVNFSTEYLVEKYKEIINLNNN
jgi:hypothetical protein